MFEKWTENRLRAFDGRGYDACTDASAHIRECHAEIDRLKSFEYAHRELLENYNTLLAEKRELQAMQSTAPTQDGRVAALIFALETIHQYKMFCFKCKAAFNVDEMYGGDDPEDHATCPKCGSEDVSQEADEIAKGALDALPATVNEGETE